MQQDWIKRLTDLIEAQLPRDFVGQLELNVFKGSVTTVNVRTTLRREDMKK